MSNRKQKITMLAMKFVHMNDRPASRRRGTLKVLNAACISMKDQSEKCRPAYFAVKSATVYIYEEG